MKTPIKISAIVAIAPPTVLRGCVVIVRSAPSVPAGPASTGKTSPFSTQI